MISADAGCHQPMRLPFASQGAYTPSLLSAAIGAVLFTAEMVQAAPRVLAYTATRGYRHDSIPTAIQVLGDAQGEWGVEFSFTE